MEIRDCLQISLVIISCSKKKLYGPFLWMGFNCLKDTEPLWRKSLLFTTKSPGVLATHLIDLGRMKSWVDLKATQRFWTWDTSVLTTRSLLHKRLFCLKLSENLWLRLNSLNIKGEIWRRSLKQYPYLSMLKSDI